MSSAHNGDQRSARRLLAASLEAGVSCVFPSPSRPQDRYLVRKIERSGPVSTISHWIAGLSELAEKAGVGMRLIGLGMVKNECDVIEQFVRHNLAFLDELVLLDNLSTDGTREMLDALTQEGLPVRVLDDPVLSYAQSEKMSALLHRIRADADPDAVLPLDADEFLITPSRAALEAALTALPPGTAGLMGWTTYLYSPEAPRSRERWWRPAPSHANTATADPDPIRRMTRRRRVERPRYYKVALRRELGTGNGWADLRLTQGNHSVAHVNSGGALPTQALEGVELGHFPVRSRNQLASKVIGGWLAYLAKDPHAAQQDAGYQWRDLYRRIVSPEGLSALSDSELEAISLGYAQTGDSESSQSSQSSQSSITDENSVVDPLAISYTRRFASLGRPDPLTTLARSFEHFLTHAGDLAAMETEAINM